MTNPEEPRQKAADAAARIASDRQGGGVPPARVLHATAWVLARAGRPAPEPVAPLHADHVAATAAAARGDLATVRDRANRALRRSTADGSAVLQGIAALGAPFSELVLDLALAHPDAHIGGTNVAAGLAQSRPDRGHEWLTWLRRRADPLPLLEASIEIVLAGRDRGTLDAVAEATWSELTQTAAGQTATWWEGRLRMLGREAPEEAAHELLDATALVGRKALHAAHLVLARWARQDRSAATRFVQEFAPRMGTWGRWTRALTHDGALSEEGRDGWRMALAVTSDDPWDVGQLLAIAVRLGDEALIDDVLAHRPQVLAGEDVVSHAERSLRLLRREAPERAAVTHRALEARLPEGHRPGELRDWLAVLTDNHFDVPWWVPYLPDLP